MKRSDEYRNNAANCRAVAEQTHDPTARALLIAMARSWRLLADQADKNSKTDVVYGPPLFETPHRRSEPPVPQQQQQIQPDKDEG